MRHAERPTRSTPLRYFAGANNGTVGSCTSKSVALRRHFCFASSSRFACSSRRPTPEGSQHPFGLGPRHRCGPYPLHYTAAFAFCLLLYPPSHRLLLRVAFPCGEATGLPRFAAVTVWVRSRLSAGGTSAALEEFGASRLGHLPFWSKRVSILRLSCVTTVTTLHLG